MNLVKIQKKTGSEIEAGYDSEERYPWGTSLDFEDDLVDELGLGQLAAGDEVMIKAKAFVKSKSQHDTTENSDKTLCIQLTEIAVHREMGDPVDQLYGKK